MSSRCKSLLKDFLAVSAIIAVSGAAAIVLIRHPIQDQSGAFIFAPRYK